METFLKINFLFLVFYLCYHFLIEQLKLLRWNRIYFLLSFILSIAIPFIYYSEYVIIEEANYNNVINNEIIPNITISQSNNFVDYWKYSTYLYVFISLIFASKLTFGIFKILKFFLNGEKQIIENVSVIVNNKIKQPFTFGKIFYPKENLTDQSYILKHEQAHCKQYHFIDMLLINIVCIIFWINPIIWLMRRKVMLNLEYLADDEVLQQTVNKKQYQMSLIAHVNNTQNQIIPVVNYFNESQILKRIKMMNQKTNPKNNWKFFIIVPILVLFFMSFQKEVVAITKNDKLNSVIEITNNSKFEINKYHFAMNTPMNEIEKNIKALKNKYSIKTIKSEFVFTENRMTQVKYSFKNKDGKTINGIAKCDDKNCIDKVFIEFKKDTETNKTYFKMYCSTLNKNEVEKLNTTYEKQLNSRNEKNRSKEEKKKDLKEIK